MNMSELAAAVAEKADILKKDAEKSVKATFECIEEALANNEKVALLGFGTFEVKDRAERNGRNPQTKEAIVIPACKAPGFKAGKVLKNAVNI